MVLGSTFPFMIVLLWHRVRQTRQIKKAIAVA
jgi:hypothetical protein